MEAGARHHRALRDFHHTICGNRRVTPRPNHKGTAPAPGAVSRASRLTQPLEIAHRLVITNPLFRPPPSGLRLPASAFRLPQSGFRNPRPNCKSFSRNHPPSYSDPFHRVYKAPAHRRTLRPLRVLMLAPFPIPTCRAEVSRRRVCRSKLRFLPKITPKQTEMAKFIG